MSNRTYIYFFLLELMHSLKEHCITLSEVTGNACISLGRSIQSLRIGLKFRMLLNRIRGSNPNVSDLGNDEDGSMMQGLLLRENL